MATWETPVHDVVVAGSSIFLSFCFAVLQECWWSCVAESLTPTSNDVSFDEGTSCMHALHSNMFSALKKDTTPTLSRRRPLRYLLPALLFNVRWRKKVHRNNPAKKTVMSIAIPRRERERKERPGTHEEGTAGYFSKCTEEVSNARTLASQAKITPLLVAPHC